MYIPIQVDAYSGHKANERPIRFWLDAKLSEIEEVEDRWYDPNAEYFKVRTTDRKRYVLRYDLDADRWSVLADNLI